MLIIIIYIGNNLNLFCYFCLFRYEKSFEEILVYENVDASDAKVLEKYDIYFFNNVNFTPVSALIKILNIPLLKFMNKMCLLLKKF